MLIKLEGFPVVPGVPPFPSAKQEVRGHPALLTQNAGKAGVVLLHQLFCDQQSVLNMSCTASSGLLIHTLVKLHIMYLAAAGVSNDLSQTTNSEIIVVLFQYEDKKRPEPAV